MNRQKLADHRPATLGGFTHFRFRPDVSLVGAMKRGPKSAVEDVVEKAAQHMLWGFVRTVTLLIVFITLVDFFRVFFSFQTQYQQILA